MSNAHHRFCSYSLEADSALLLRHEMFANSCCRGTPSLPTNLTTARHEGVAWPGQAHVIISVHLVLPYKWVAWND